MADYKMTPGSREVNTPTNFRSASIAEEFLEQHIPSVSEPRPSNPEGAYHSGAVGEEADWSAVHDNIQNSVSQMADDLGDAMKAYNSPEGEAFRIGRKKKADERKAARRKRRDSN